MSAMTPLEGEEPLPLPSVTDYKNMVAKAIIFKATQKLVRPMFQAFQANVTAYTVSVMAKIIGENFDFDRVWSKQNLSPELLEMISFWAKEVNELLHRSANGRMVSEWAKKAECREYILNATYSIPKANVPEIKN